MLNQLTSFWRKNKSLQSKNITMYKIVKKAGKRVYVEKEKSMSQVLAN